MTPSGNPQGWRGAAAVWAYRHRFELDAAERFDRLARRLSDFDGPAEIVDMLQSAATDERRHAALCCGLIEHFEGPPPPASYPLAAPASPTHLSARDRLTYEIVAMACITESLSCALLAQLCESAADDRVKTTMQSILRDEVRHSRLGWAYLATLKSNSSKELLSAALPSMLAATVPESLFQGAPNALPTPTECVLGGLGSLPRAERLRIFVASMREVVFPGFRHFGVHPTPAQSWLDGALKHASSDPVNR